jgi:hypothetical protein
MKNISQNADSLSETRLLDAGKGQERRGIEEYRPSLEGRSTMPQSSIISKLKQLDKYYAPKFDLDYEYNKKFKRLPVMTDTKKIWKSIQNHESYQYRKDKQAELNKKYRIQTKEKAKVDEDFKKKLIWDNRKRNMLHDARRAVPRRKITLLHHLEILKHRSPNVREIAEIETIIMNLVVKRRTPLFLLPYNQNLPAEIKPNFFLIEHNYTCKRKLEAYKKQCVRIVKHFLKNYEIFKDGQGKELMRALWLLKHIEFQNKTNRKPTSILSIVEAYEKSKLKPIAEASER